MNSRCVYELVTALHDAQPQLTNFKDNRCGHLKWQLNVCTLIYLYFLAVFGSVYSS